MRGLYISPLCAVALYKSLSVHRRSRVRNISLWTHYLETLTEATKAYSCSGTLFLIVRLILELSPSHCPNNFFSRYIED
jgi:hypothetical protein